jgi:hypothetical protein
MKDLTKQKFNNLTVIKFSHRKNEKYFWLCKCDCGNETIVEAYRLTRGLTKSCGCLRITSNTKHGAYNKKIYQLYYSMLHRCYNSKDKDYKHYGQKGIIVCKEWKNSFVEFFKWAMLNGYQEDLSIDRIDSNGNYEPSNCRWVTLKEQARNKKNIKKVTYKEKEYYISDLAKEFNINRNTLNSRLIAGWSIEKALTKQKKINEVEDEG